jgi:hypothetical protein
MSTIFMLSPVPGKAFAVSSGNTYVSDSATGIISNVASVADQKALASLGCALLNPNPTDQIGKLLAADFNSTVDQFIPLNNNVRYRITKVTVLNTSLDGMNYALGGLYTGPSKGGSVIVGATQDYSGLTNATTALDLTLAAPGLVLPPQTTLYFSLSRAQGATATADIYITADVYP